MQHTISKRLVGVVALVVMIVAGYYLLTNSPAPTADNQNKEASNELPLFALSAAEGRSVDVNLNAGQLLYLANNESVSDGIGGGGHMQGKDLVVKDVNTGEKKTIAKDVIEAKFSPDATKVVVANADDEVLLLDSNGTQLAKLGKHGSGPIFSNDGKFIAYHKLADEGEGQDLFEKSPYGLVLYDIEKRAEKILTKNKDDYEPLGFSADMTKLYFNSARAYDSEIEGYENHVASLWVLDMKTSDVTRLTNLDENEELQKGSDPRVTSGALWSTDRKTIISEADGEVWKFVLSDDGMLEGVSKLAQGTEISWNLIDQSINLLTTEKQKSAWEVVDIN